LQRFHLEEKYIQILPILWCTDIFKLHLQTATLWRRLPSGMLSYKFTDVSQVLTAAVIRSMMVPHWYSISFLFRCRFNFNLLL
jgi:hypothetical protein